MRGRRERVNRCLECIQRSLNETPLTPSALHPAAGKDNARVVCKSRAKLVVGSLGRTRVEMDRDPITGHRQCTRLGDNLVFRAVTFS